MPNRSLPRHRSSGTHCGTASVILSGSPTTRFRLAPSPLNDEDGRYGHYDPVNGTAPPEVALGDIDLGGWDFWALDDDLRDGAFTTLRREAPISFWPARS